MTPQEILDRSPMRPLQITAVAICVLLNAVDGFDVLAISFASPGIASEWGIERAALGIVLSMELIGMAVGSVVIGPIADRYGRRPIILACLVFMTAGMFATAQASSVIELSAYRLGTGLGIGGMLAVINAMTAEYANARYRPMAVIIMASGYPLGAVLGGAVVSNMLVSFDWRVVFVFGGVVTALCIPLVYWLLPESVAFLAGQNRPNALNKINAILARIGHATADTLPPATAKTSVTELFSEDLRRQTLVLTVAYFCHIMTFYFIIKWIPKLVVDMGYAASEAGGVLVWANLGGLAGCVAMGVLSRSFNVKRLILILLVGSAAMVAFFGQGQQSDLTELATLAGIAGFFTNGVIVGLYALFAHVFPTNVRAGGTGFVIGMGRGGSALGPVVAGFMFAMSFGLDSVALLMSIGSIIALVAISFLRFSPEQKLT